MEIKKIDSKKSASKSSSKKPIIITKKSTTKSTPKTKRPNNNKPISIEKVKKKKGRAGKLINAVLSFFMFFGIIGMIAVMVFCGYIVMSAPAFNTDLLYSKEASIFYDKYGKEFARVGAEQRELVYYNDLPEVLVDAIVATEDSRYFQHNGFDGVRFAKAAFGQVVGQSGAGGASTLTMQVVKNTFTSTEAAGWEGIVRKFTDIYMAIFLVEKNYTKEEIIEYGRQINAERNKIATSFNELSEEERERQYIQESTKIELLEFKMWSVRDILWHKQGHLKFPLPNGTNIDYLVSNDNEIANNILRKVTIPDENKNNKLKKKNCAIALIILLILLFSILSSIGYCQKLIEYKDDLN